MTTLVNSGRKDEQLEQMLALSIVFSLSVCIASVIVSYSLGVERDFTCFRNHPTTIIQYGGGTTGKENSSFSAVCHPVVTTIRRSSFSLFASFLILCVPFFLQSLSFSLFHSASLLVCVCVCVSV